MIENKEVAVLIDKLMREITKEMNQSIILVKEQCSEEEFKTYRRAAAEVMGNIFEGIMVPIYKKHTDIMPDELKDHLITKDEIKELAISDEDIAIIEQKLLNYITNDWKKMARVIMEAMFELREQDTRWNKIPDVYYAYLVRELVTAKKISFRGDLYQMRFCEVRLEDI